MTHSVKRFTRALVAALLVLPAVVSATARQQVNSPSAENAARAAESSRAVGSISGRVVADGGQPLEGATVFIRRADSASPPRTTTTDEDGRFTLDDLAEGAYTATASARGYFTPDAPSGAEESKTYRPGDSVSIVLAKGGVITGKVSDARGEPVTGLTVRAIRTRDAEGSAESFGSEVSRQTDDRGVYRLFGLKPGTYVVAAGGAGRQSSQRDPYRNAALSYYPSETRDSAAEVKVAAGVETNAVDIRFRGDSGHTVSGVIAGLPAGSRAPVSLALVYSGLNMAAASATAAPGNGAGGFAFNGISDGEYELLARSVDQSGVGLMATQHVVVKGGNVEGLRVSLVPLGAISGRIAIEPAAAAAGTDANACKPASEPATRDILFTARAAGDSREQATSRAVAAGLIQSSPDEKGEFTLVNLPAGSYRVEARPPGGGWYVKAMTLQPSPQAPRPRATAKALDAGRNGVTLKSGERVGGLTVTFAYGAASLQGQVAQESKASLPAHARLYLVPAETEAAEDVLRYVEATIAGDGSFAVKDIAPGRYLAVIEPWSADARRTRPAAWDAARRAKLRSDAAAAQTAVELHPCQQLTGFNVPYATTMQPRPAPAPAAAN
jgi:protocatechuate 3,4-dioxygenase beta subunit